MELNINYLSLIIATVASTVAGFAWYGSLFKEPWMKLMGYTKKSMEAAQQGMEKMYALSTLMTVLMAFVLQHTMQLSQTFYETTALSAGISTAFWMWLGFVLPVQMTRVIFGKDAWNLLWINTGYQLTSLLLMGLVMGVMA